MPHNHDFKRFPELTNSQMDFYYWDSPHKQILEDFDARVVKVIDGDTIRVKTDFRDFDFPVRFLDTNAPEMNEGGKESREWLKALIDGEDVKILIDRNIRVGKFGRLLGRIIHQGIDMNEMSIITGHATTFENRNENKIPNLNEIFPEL